MTKSNTSLRSRKRVRMRDVANRCGVSISTVSLVLSGDTRIPEDTARKVLETVKAMEYRPSVIARSLARKGSRTIGVILPEFGFSKNQAFYYQALQGIHAQTQVAGYKMVVEAANRVFLERRYYLRMLKEQSTDGMIYLAAATADAFLEEVAKESYPFVLVGSSADGVDLPCIQGDDFAGAKTVTKHLISLGHKVIGHIAGTAEISNGRDREKGFRAAMSEAGLAVNESMIVQADFDTAKAEEATQKLLEAKVTAIFAGSDSMAYGAMRAIRKAGLSIPKDVAVAGMDDLEMSAWTNPSLTTIRYDIAGMAGRAARFVLKQVQNPMVSKKEMGETPPPELIIRESCGAKR